MKIIEKDIDSLIPYEFNNKIHDETQINRIANSIKEFWFLQPVVIDKNNIIIVWHGRVEGAKKLWLKSVPCILADDLTDEQVKKFRILDNKLNESEWNLENLKVDLEELWNLDIWELKIDIDELFPDLDTEEEDEPEVEEDEAPEVQEQAKMVRGGGFIHSLKSSLEMLRFNKDWRRWRIDGLKARWRSIYRSSVLNVPWYWLQRHEMILLKE